MILRSEFAIYVKILRKESTILKVNSHSSENLLLSVKLVL